MSKRAQLCATVQCHQHKSVITHHFIKLAFVSVKKDLWIEIPWMKIYCESQQLQLRSMTTHSQYPLCSNEAAQCHQHRSIAQPNDTCFPFRFMRVSITYIHMYTQMYTHTPHTRPHITPQHHAHAAHMCTPSWLVMCAGPEGLQCDTLHKKY